MTNNRAAASAVMSIVLAVLAQAGMTTHAAAQSKGCAGYGDALKGEVTAIATSAATITASASVDTAPPLPVGRAVTVRLPRQGSVSFPVPPESKRGTADSFAGLLSLGRLPPGTWRVSANTRVWFDVVAGQRALASPSFDMRMDCDVLRKVVVFEQPTEQEAVLQISGGEAAEVRVLVTEARPPSSQTKR